MHRDVVFNESSLGDLGSEFARVVTAALVAGLGAPSASMLSDRYE